MSNPAAYISYSWGDGETAEGREREEIVDNLCSSFAEVGIEIGRDKNEIKPGDSIEKFGVRIAKAPLILAVISARSLRSEWCMLYELYEAYTRRGSNGNEFTEAVVALVLDDAEADLNNNKSLIKYWSAKCIEYGETLDIADPCAERSLESRKVLGKYREMIRSLPDMLLAIRRIAMPRGSAAIRRNDFKEIREYVQFKLYGPKGSEAFAPLSQRLGALPMDQPMPNPTKPAPARTACDAVALVLTPSGEEKQDGRYYQWGPLFRGLEKISSKRYLAALSEQSLPTLKSRWRSYCSTCNAGSIISLRMNPYWRSLHPMFCLMKIGEHQHSGWRGSQATAHLSTLSPALLGSPAQLPME